LQNKLKYSIKMALHDGQEKDTMAAHVDNTKEMTVARDVEDDIAAEAIGKSENYERYEKQR
jgi:hypothetical protein